jgi:iron(III) transport system ATP-binding protein
MAADDAFDVLGSTTGRAGVAIHIDRLSHAFAPVAAPEVAWVLDDLTLTVPAGSTMALLGPSGCGKSTLLKLLAGLLRPSCGAIRFGERYVASGTARAGAALPDDFPRNAWIAPEGRSLGMVFQDYALWPHMTVAGNVSFPLEMRGVSRPARRQRVHEALTLVGLAHLADRRPQALSGGQQQRVALARAIVAAPDVLLFDEPLSNLDRDLRARLCEDIGAMLRRLGTTAVYVTHDPEEAHALASNIATLAQGRVATVCPVRTAAATPPSQSDTPPPFVDAARPSANTRTGPGDAIRTDGASSALHPKIRLS